DVRYLTRAGFEEIAILKGRQPISEMVEDPETPSELRASLELVLQARDFAASLGLDAKETYTTYSDVGRDTLLLVLSAAPRDCLCAYTWKYPIVGRIPYKGFFDPDMAQSEAEELAELGYDTYLRPSSAFSTLGWFNDPLLSTAASRDSVEMVALVLHEILHNTIYVKSATPFNESFAQMVGYRGAEAFFREHGDTVAAARAAARWQDEIVLGEFYAALGARLDSLYNSTEDSATIARGREEIGRWARQELQGPVAERLVTYNIGRLPERPINNARIIAARIYRTRLPLIEKWYQANGADVRQSVAAVKEGLDGSDDVWGILTSISAPPTGSPGAAPPPPRRTDRPDRE
ncbi:MAG: aminopeptidase, partial [Gemmatimonadales bacterium]